MEDILHQLIGIVCPIFYKVFFTSLVVQGFSTNSIIKPPTWHSLNKRWDPSLYPIASHVWHICLHWSHKIQPFMDRYIFYTLVNIGKNTAWYRIPTYPLWIKHAGRYQVYTWYATCNKHITYCEFRGWHSKFNHHQMQQQGTHECFRGAIAKVRLEDPTLIGGKT